MNRLQRNLKTMDVPLKVALKQHADSSFKKYNLLKVLNLSNSEYNAINNLSSSRNIVFVFHKSGKEDFVVLMNRDDYSKQMETLISDPAKLQQ